jgi:hypothetical protein
MARRAQVVATEGLPRMRDNPVDVIEARPRTRAAAI